MAERERFQETDIKFDCLNNNNLNAGHSLIKRNFPVIGVRSQNVYLHRLSIRSDFQMRSFETTRLERLCMLLRQARVQSGMTQAELNRKLGAYKGFVSKYEIGERELTVTEFIEVAEALDTDPGSILKAILNQ